MTSFLLACLLLCAIYLLNCLQFPRKTQQKRLTKSRFTNSQANSGVERTASPRRVSAATQNQLYRLVHDQQAVERLIEHTRSYNSGRSEQWIWEKVIHDLERDRGYR